VALRCGGSQHQRRGGINVASASGENIEMKISVAAKNNKT